MKKENPSRCFCEYCGAEMNLTDAKCPLCGAVNNKYVAPAPTGSFVVIPTDLVKTDNSNGENTTATPTSPTPTVIYNQNTIAPETEYEKKSKKRVGYFVAGIITFVFAVALLILSFTTFYQFFQGLTENDDALKVFLILIYIFTGLGFITTIPGLGCGVASLVCNIKACSSTNKVIKAFAIVFTILSSIVLVGYFFLFAIYPLILG